MLGGLSNHLMLCEDELGPTFLANDQRLPRHVFVATDDFPIGSPESPWDEIITATTDAAASEFNVAFTDLFEQKFSTTEKVESVVLKIAFLSTAKRYVKYIPQKMICGIPTITLEGTSDDWIKLRTLIERFQDYDLDWWLNHLRPILDEFVDASRGSVNREHWQKLYSAVPSGCGVDDWVTGWIGKLFPYKVSAGWPLRRNPLLDWKEESPPPKAYAFTKNVSELTLRSQRNTNIRLFEGLLGLSQLAETGALRPKIAWSVSRQSSFADLMDQIAGLANCISEPSKEALVAVRSDKMKQFYARFHSMTLSDRNGNFFCRFHSVGEMPKDYDLMLSNDQKPMRWYIPIAQLHDGRFIGVLATTSTEDDDNFWRMAIFLADSEFTSLVNLVTGDFEELLRWIFSEVSRTDGATSELTTIETIDMKDGKHMEVTAILDSQWQSPCEIPDTTNW